MGFRNLHDFNIALLGNHCWNFTKQPQSLVARVYKARYFYDSHFLRAKKGDGSSFIWSGIWTAKKTLFKGYRWVVGDGKEILITKDPWLRKKKDYYVDQVGGSPGGDDYVASLILPDLKKWDEDQIRNRFHDADARAILATPIPQRAVKDRVAWVRTSDGNYNVKSCYHLWHEQVFGSNLLTQSKGWKKIWSLVIPNNMKVF